VLTGRLVPLRKRQNGGLGLTRAEGKRLPRALELASNVGRQLQACVGKTRSDVNAAMRLVEATPGERVFLLGLTAMYTDASEWDLLTREIAEARRAGLFHAAAIARKQGSGFDRAAILRAHEIDANALRSYLYGDLETEHVLRRVPAWAPEHAIAQYNESIEQGLLAQAEDVSFHVARTDLYKLPHFFRVLKFRGLFCAIAQRTESLGEQATSGEVEFSLSGPSALFSTGSRDGLRIALAYPHLRGLVPFTIRATVRRHGGERLVWEERVPAVPREHAHAPEIAALLEDFADSEWTLKPAHALLTYTGGGVAVPEFVAVRGQQRVYIELFGPWSRGSVFERLENPTAHTLEGESAALLLCVPKKARVKIASQEPRAPAANSHQLLSYDGTLTAAKIRNSLQDFANFATDRKSR
jgi:predicted nuclease of restriction endonuclease-like RecB superfamily